MSTLRVQNLIAENITAKSIERGSTAAPSLVTDSGVETGVFGSNFDGLTIANVENGVQVWQRIGDVVFVSGTLEVQIGFEAGVGNFEIPLPVASNFTATTDACGIIAPSNSAHAISGGIAASMSNDTLVVSLAQNGSEVLTTLSYSAMYLVK